jgi:hypothetical protein
MIKKRRKDIDTFLSDDGGITYAESNHPAGQGGFHTIKVKSFTRGPKFRLRS